VAAVPIHIEQSITQVLTGILVELMVAGLRVIG
jgi:hypothetical protein